MNKIYKVKKNAAGHSVACSEFAKGHVRQAVLGSLLIAGALGISNTASAQSVHYSDYSGSYDLDCYRSSKGECIVISGKHNTISKDIASTISGGYGNEIKHPDDDNINAVTISGGKFNKAMQTDATVSGGSKNQAMSGGSTVGGGHKNIAKGETATVGGGRDNQATGKSSTVSGGEQNFATGDKSTISGGTFNRAIGDSTTVAGGKLNYAIGDHSAINGGELNQATGKHATIAGGSKNQAKGNGSFAAGVENKAEGNQSTVAGGYQNQAKNNQSTVGGGSNNKAEGNQSTVAGGHSNIANGNQSNVAGGYNNKATGVGSTVAGGYNNKAEANQSTVGGGHSNIAKGETATVAGGSNNKAEGNQSTVGGGSGNQATGKQSTISGGDANKATNQYSTVGGGRLNQATGRNSTVAGGYDNRATGNGSFAAGVENQAITENAVAVGKKNIIEGANSAAIGSTNTVAEDKKNVFILGSNTSRVESNSVLLGNETSGKQATAVSDATVGNLNLKGFAGVSNANSGTVSVGSENNERQIVNVGAGQITDTSTDAVNGSQLYALGTAVSQNQADIAKNKADIDNNINNIYELAQQQDQHGSDIKTLAKAGSENTQNIEDLAAYNELQDAYAKQQTDAIDALNKASSANTKRITTAELGIAENKKDAQIAKAQANENKADIAANKADADAKFKGVQTDIANNKITLAQHTKKIDDNQQAIEAKLGGKADLQKLAELKTSVDKNQADIAANKADADASFETLTKNQNTLIEQGEAQDALIAQNQTDITANKTAIEQNVNRTVVNGFEIEKNKAGIATNKQELIIQNNRLNRIDETNNRQDQKIDQLGYALKEQGQYFNSRISAVERQTAGGIANAIAIATLPSPNRAGEHHVLFGSGYHNGQAAVSLGAAGSSDTGKSTYKIGLSWSDAGGLSGGVGGSYRWK